MISARPGALPLGASLVASGASEGSDLTPPSNLRREDTHLVSVVTPSSSGTWGGPAAEVSVSAAGAAPPVAAPPLARSAKRRYFLGALYVAVVGYSVGAVAYVLVWAVSR